MGSWSIKFELLFHQYLEFFIHGLAILFSVGYRRYIIIKIFFGRKVMKISKRVPLRHRLSVFNTLIFFCQRNFSETAQQNFMKLCSYEGLNVFYVLGLILSGPSGSWGDGKGFPFGSVCRNVRGCIYGESSGFKIFIYCKSPCLLWTTSVSSPLWSPS